MKKIIFGVAGFLSLWGFAFFAQAQENAAGEDNNAEVSDIVLIADVNIHEAQIASREENKSSCYLNSLMEKEYNQISDIL